MISLFWNSFALHIKEERTPEYKETRTMMNMKEGQRLRQGHEVVDTERGK